MIGTNRTFAKKSYSKEFDFYCTLILSPANFSTSYIKTGQLKVRYSY